MRELFSETSTRAAPLRMYASRFEKELRLYTILTEGIQGWCTITC